MLAQFTAHNADAEHAKHNVFIQSVPLGRLVDPSDIAGAVSYLLSDAAGTGREQGFVALTKLYPNEKYCDTLCNT
ncbi:hypothetical protein LSPH24S_02727 [Lysinibacillus sphaericus]